MGKISVKHGGSHTSIIDQAHSWFKTILQIDSVKTGISGVIKGKKCSRGIQRIKICLNESCVVVKFICPLRVQMFRFYPIDGDLNVMYSEISRKSEEFGRENNYKVEFPLEIGEEDKEEEETEDESSQLISELVAQINKAAKKGNCQEFETLEDLLKALADDESELTKAILEVLLEQITKEKEIFSITAKKNKELRQNLAKFANETKTLRAKIQELESQDLWPQIISRAKKIFRHIRKTIKNIFHR